MASPPPHPDAPRRILVFAPYGRDAGALRAILAGEQIASVDCATPAELYAHIGEQALLLLITEEGLAQCTVGALAARLRAQPLWSDLPIVALAGSARAASAGSRLAPLAELGNVTLIDRPVAHQALLMAVRAALRARALQFQVRDQLAQLERHSAELERRVAERGAALAREVEERERAEAALAEARRLESLGRLTGGVAHDVNNLLQVVSGAVELLRLLTRKEAEPRIGRALDSIARATGKGSRLTQQLLAYARRQPLAVTTIDLRAQLDGTAALLHPPLGEAIALRIDAADDLWAVRADPTQLEVALLNLVINARDAMPHGGTVTLALRNRTLPSEALPELHGLDGNYVCIELSDQGCGMSDATVARAFEPFFTTKPVGKGTGLGLSQVDGFARQSGGQAFIRCEAGGTTVGLLLPAAAACAASPPAAPAGDLAPALPPGLRVLCVDDDPMVAEVATAMFERWGCSVTHAASAEAALQAGLDGVDLVFSDVMMPGALDGIGLARQLNAQYPALPVVLASGYVMAPERLQGVDALFVRKPYSAEQLLAAAARALERVRERETGAA